MIQLSHALAAYNTGFKVSLTESYSSIWDLTSSETWPHEIDIKIRAIAGMMSTIIARAQDMTTLAAAQKSHA